MAKQFNDAGAYIPAQKGERQSHRDEQFDVRPGNTSTDPAGIAVDGFPNIPKQANHAPKQDHTDNFDPRKVDVDRSYPRSAGEPAGQPGEEVR